MISKLFKQIREELGLTQQQTAELLQTTPQNIRHYENRDNPTLATMKLFSKNLGLNILIENGEVMRMKQKTGHSKTIEEIRERLEQQFKYTGRIAVEELVGQMVQLAEDELQVDFIGWRPFLPKELLPDVENPKEEDWLTYFTNPDFGWGRFEFDIEFSGISYVQGISFKIENPNCFAEIVKEFLPQTDEEWGRFSDVCLWTDVVERAVYSKLGNDLFDLMISDIQIER